MNKKKSIIIIVILLIATGLSVSLLIVFIQPLGGTDGNGPITGNLFISVWNTTLTSSGSSNTDQIKLPLESSGTYNFSVEWGDGTEDIVMSWDQAETTHTYPSEGIYSINITGTIIGWNFQNGGDKLKILEIQQWGNLRLGNSGSYFSGCSNIEITAKDNLNLNGTTDLNRMFMSCVNLIGHESMNNWNVSEVTNMYGLFWHAHKFNSSIGNWDVSRVERMRNMFCRAESFNQDIGNWDVFNVKEMNGMFGASHAFNQNISNWNVSNVEDMGGMFGYAYSFDQDIGTWNVSQVSNMAGMFNEVTLSIANYDSLLLGWSSLTLQSEVTLNAGNSQCTSPGAPADARQYIVDTFNWTIIDGDGTHSP